MASNDNENTAAQVYLLGKTYLANNQGQFYIKNDPIVNMAAGDRHTIIVTESGRAFAFGDNSSGQLGLGHTDKIEKVSCIKSLKSNETGEKVILAACGRESSIVATDRGSIYSFGSNSRSQLGFEAPSESEINQPNPTKIDSFKGKNIWKQIAMGAEHACALTDDGLVYVWGANDEGQCGQIKKYDVISKPRELRMEQPVVAISCGYYHTALITDDGLLHLMGSNDDRQLGCTISDKFAGPTKVSIPDKVVAVACGYQHTVVLTKNGEVYVCGYGNRGQLGLGSRVSTAETFELIPNIPKRITGIAAGEAHTAIISARKDLYVFGDGKHGKLGASTQSNQFDPCLVEKFKNYDVLKVVCGGCQTIVLAQKKTSETGKGSESEEENAHTLNSRSLARTMRAKNIAERSLQVNDSMDSTLKPRRPSPSNQLRTEHDDDDRSDRELSESLRSATFNQTHTITNGRFKPTQTTNIHRPNERGTNNNDVKTGVFDRTVRLNRDDSPKPSTNKTPTSLSRFERQSPPSPRRKQQDFDRSPPSPRKKREKSVSPPVPRRKKSPSPDSSSSSSSSSKERRPKTPPKKFEKQSSPITKRRQNDSDDDDNRYNNKRQSKKHSESDDNDDHNRSSRTTKQPPPPPARRTSLPSNNLPKSNARDGNQTIGSRPVDGVRGSFRPNANKSLAKPTPAAAAETKPAEQPGFFRRLFGGKSSTPTPPPPPPPPPAAATPANPASKTCSVM